MFSIIGEPLEVGLGKSCGVLRDCSCLGGAGGSARIDEPCAEFPRGVVSGACGFGTAGGCRVGGPRKSGLLKELSCTLGTRFVVLILGSLPDITLGGEVADRSWLSNAAGFSEVRLTDCKLSAFSKFLLSIASSCIITPNRRYMLLKLSSNCLGVLTCLWVAGSRTGRAFWRRR